MRGTSKISAAAALVAVAAVAASSLAAPALAQGPPPPTPSYGTTVNGDASSPVTLAYFYDLLCPGSAQSFPVMSQVAQHYGEQLRLDMYLYPRAQAQFSFLADQGAAVVQSHVSGPAGYLSYVKNVLETQGDFSNANTLNRTATAVLASLGSLAAPYLGADEFAREVAAGTGADFTANALAYGSSRGVTATPAWLVNDVPVAGDPTWTVDDWVSVLDSVVNPGPSADDASNVPRSTCRGAGPFLSAALGSCPSGTTSCTYLPGKVQCCLQGEQCIKNVGCRC